MHYEFNKRIAGIGCHHPYMCWPYLTTGLVMDCSTLAATVTSGGPNYISFTTRPMDSNKKPHKNRQCRSITTTPQPTNT